jgi:hypothetical protein
MRPPVPLDAFLRRMSRIAEQQFNRVGEIDPIWLVESASGDQRVIVSPITAPSGLAGTAYKDALGEKMREIFAEHDVARYARAMECWVAPLGGNTDEQVAQRYAALGYSLEKHPQRREMVLLEADDGTEFLQAKREIVRPPHGRAYLGNLGEIVRPPKVSGRFLALLPSEQGARRDAPPSPAMPRLLPDRGGSSSALPRVRSSSELPEDAGRVFITNVPDAPLQVMGRRDPTTGELCVSRWRYRRPGDPDPDLSKAPAFIEIVTGSEAEWLIFALQCRLTAQADAQGLTFEELLARAELEGKEEKDG